MVLLDIGHEPHRRAAPANGRKPCEGQGSFAREKRNVSAGVILCSILFEVGNLNFVSAECLAFRYKASLCVNRCAAAVLEVTSREHIKCIARGCTTAALLLRLDKTAGSAPEAQNGCHENCVNSRALVGGYTKYA